MQIYFFVPGKPRGKGRPKFFKGHAVTDDKTRDYEAMIRHKATMAMAHLKRYVGDEMIAELTSRLCRVELKAFFLVPKSYSKVKREAALNSLIRPSKPDVDNIVKSILDGMNGIVFHDDVQVFRVDCEKRFSDCLEGVQVIVHWEDKHESGS